MHILIDFWKLETENNLLHVFSFLHKLSFENSFCFLSILSCQKTFLVSKIENCFLKQKIREKNSYQKNDCQKLFWQFFSFSIKMMSKLFLNRLLTSALRTLINITLKYNIIFTSFIKDTIIILHDCNQQVILGSPKKKKKSHFNNYKFFLAMRDLLYLLYKLWHSLKKT